MSAASDAPPAAPSNPEPLAPLDRLEPLSVRMALTAEPLAGPDACPLRP